MVEITELPVRKWTQDYKEFLDAMVKPELKTANPAILDYRYLPPSLPHNICLILPINSYVKAPKSSWT